MSERHLAAVLHLLKPIENECHNRVVSPVSGRHLAALMHIPRPQLRDNENRNYGITSLPVMRLTVLVRLQKSIEQTNATTG